MKIEKISDKQIRCTLTTADLIDFNMKFSELAYGSEAARALFKEMITKAHDECGFDASSGPLMIEAVPTGAGSLTLVITRVDDPEELDTRFAKFTPDSLGHGGSKEAPTLKGADDILDLYGQKESAAEAAPKRKRRRKDAAIKENQAKPVDADMVRLFAFKDLDTVIAASGILKGIFDAPNTLYHEEKEEAYCLIVHKTDLTPESFNRICNTLSEYSTMYDCTSSREAHLKEHAKLIVKDRALQTLAELA
ncbi:MAG: adaptor protein MecA [Lachnospiraceae bacterium]|nr:adaptor protein MecA [Candidatus Equihabitans merdae]